MGYMTTSTGGRILFFLSECLRMGPFKIPLVLLGMALLTFLIVKKKSRTSVEKFWVRMFHPLFFDI